MVKAEEPKKTKRGQSLKLAKYLILITLTAILIACEDDDLPKALFSPELEKLPLSQITVSLISVRDDWSIGEKMSTILEIQNVSREKINLRVEEINFSLSPADSALTKIKLEAKTEEKKLETGSVFVLSLKKREVSKLKFVVSEKVHGEKATSIFDSLSRGKYKLSILVKIVEPRRENDEFKEVTATYEEGVDLELKDGKQIEEYSINVKGKIKGNLIFESMNWKKGDLIPMTIELKNVSREDLILKIYSAQLMLIGQQHGKSFLVKFDLKIGEEITLDSFARELKITRGDTFQTQFSLAHQPWNCLTCENKSALWYENLEAGKYIINFQFEIEDGKEQPTVISSNGYQVNLLERL